MCTQPASVVYRFRVVHTCARTTLQEAHNLTRTRGSPLAHAEIVCMELAAQRLGAWRLLDCTLYVTTEPCPMCAGAILQARLKRLVYGM